MGQLPQDLGDRFTNLSLEQVENLSEPLLETDLLLWVDVHWQKV